MYKKGDHALPAIRSIIDYDAYFPSSSIHLICLFVTLVHDAYMYSLQRHPPHGELSKHRLG